MVTRRAHLIWTGDDFRELSFLLILPLDYGFDDGRVVGAEIDEDVSNAGLQHLAVEARNERPGYNVPPR